LDLLHARVAFRQRSLTDVLDLALRFVVVHARAYAKVALGSLVPLLGLALMIGASIGWALSWVLTVPLALAAEVAFTVLASRLVFQDEVRASDILRDALRESPRLAFVRVLSVVVVVFGLFVLVVPGVWAMLAFVFVGEVMLLERATLGRSFGRAYRVASSAMSESLLAALVLWLLPVIGVLLGDIGGRALLGELLQFRAPRAVWIDGGSPLATIGLFLQVPYLATARFFVYLDVRTRAEGWDIQTRFAALGARSEET
jgi:hypothetical protein